MDPSLCEVRDLLIEYHSWKHTNPVDGLFPRRPTLPTASQQNLFLTKGCCFLVLHSDPEDGFPRATAITLLPSQKRRRRLKLVGPATCRPHWEGRWARSLDMQTSEYNGTFENSED